ncbi:MAG: hypothetical protein JW837_10125 [Sedimentisphaerales bacterium]|nr:hypothetical protein [Sedimentisphaerales bacterium]
MCKKLILLICLVLTLYPAGSTSAQLLVHYKLDETSGNTAVDSSGKGNDGIIEGTPVWTAGWLDGALEFDGSLSVTLPAGNMGLRSDTGSVTFWMNMAELTGGINTLWWGGDNDTGGGMGPENEMHIHIEFPVADIWEGGELCFRVRHTPIVHLHSDPEKGDASVPGDPPVNPILMNDGQWHHVSCTWGDANGNVNLYLDGSLLQQAVYTTPSYPLTNIYLGRMADGGRTYTGLLDDVQIYGGALTVDEIQIIMAGSEVLSLAAALPEPANQAVDVPRDKVLSWLAGDRADKHNVYFGTVLDDVMNADTTNPLGVLVGENQEGSTYTPDNLLEFNRTYYWRVDEVNAPPDSGIIKGNIWSFTTVNFIVVDDFEAYTDIPPDDIFSTWIDGFGIETNGGIIGYENPDFEADEHFLETTIIHSGSQSMPFFYENDMKYSQAYRSLSDSLKDWTADGVVNLSLWFRGNPAYVGGFAEDPAGTYTVTGSGTDIWAESDEFHFAFKEVNGASSIIAKVESLENTDPFAKAGVMIRDTLDEDSPYVGVFITPENGVRFQYRSTAGAITERLFTEGIAAPQWVKLERTAGGLVRSYYSADGNTWTRFDLIQVGMEMPVYVGLAVTSHNSELACEAKFTNVSFPSTNAGEQWTDRDVGMLSNHAEPMYIALNGNAVYHENPDATLIDTWMQWTIPLPTFAEKGVDLTNIDTIAIGFGIEDNIRAGGSGTMYFDDIRLYRPEPVDTPAIEGLVHQYTFDDGTANDSIGKAHGTLVGDASIVDGSLVLDGDGDWMEMPGDIIAMNTFEELTIEIMFTSVAGGNTGFHMVTAFGEEGTGANPGYGYKYVCITPARGNNVSRAMIQTVSMDNDPWTEETGVSDVIEHDDGLPHHMVCTIDDTELAFYIDGVLIGTAALDPPGNSIAGIGTDAAYIGKGVYGVDPLWAGSVDELNIYNRALSADEISNLANKE